jgi:hypothetical protein
MIRKVVADSSCETNISTTNAQIPRKVYFDSESVKALGLALFMLLFGIVILIWMSHEEITGLHIQHVLSRDGHAVSGHIEMISPTRLGEFVKYTFSVDGMSYSGQAQMEVLDYTLPGDREGILIRYLPKDPRVNQPASWRWAPIWDFFPCLLLLSITWVGGNVTLKALRLRTLMRIGIAAVGRVTACAPNKALFTVYYEFTTEEDKVAEGSSKLADEYEVGASIPIIYLRSNPIRNSRYPVPGFRIAE